MVIRFLRVRNKGVFSQIPVHLLFYGFVPTHLSSQAGRGKGKLVDILAQNVQLCARFNGGANAGHTLLLGLEEDLWRIWRRFLEGYVSEIIGHWKLSMLVRDELSVEAHNFDRSISIVMCGLVRTAV